MKKLKKNWKLCSEKKKSKSVGRHDFNNFYGELGLTGSYIFTGSVCAEPIQKIINFQGFLTTSDGVAVVDDTYTMTFSLWDGPNDSTATKLWDENVQLTVTRGLYSVNLGESNPIPYTLNFGDQHYIGVQLGAGDILKINGSLIPTVNAWHAFRADTASGRNVRSINQSSTLEETDDIVLTSGTITVTLPPAANVPEKWYTIKKMDDNATTLTIDTSNGELINDTDSMDITKELIDLSIISNGLQWYSVGSTLISGITTTQLLDNVITSAKIEDETITGSDFQNSAVDTTQLADNSITSDKIANNTITGSDIQNSAINTTQLADNSVTPSKLAGNPGNGISGETLLSQGDGTFRWEDVGGAFTTQEITGDHTVETGNVGIGTLTPTEKLEVDGNIKITNGLILANGPGSVSQTILKALSQSEARTISLPDASGVVIVTEDGSVTIPDGSITASKLANNPGNGITGNVLISNGDGSFVWGDSRETFTTIEGSASLDYSFGSNGTDIGQFDSGIHIAIDSNGNIYVADNNNNRIQVFTSSGSYSYSIGTDNQGFDQGEFCIPDYIELDTNNNIYVTEYCGHRVQVFTSSGEYSYSIGSFGSDPGQFNRPAGIVIDNNGNIFVADSMNHRIQVFTASGEYSYSIGTGSSGSDPGQFSQPKGLALDSKGNFYVTDLFNHRIQVFTASGNYSYSFGGEGAEPGQFSFPYGICVDSNDLIYTAETGNDRIQVFSASGSFEYSISVNSPMGVKVYNDKIYVASVGDSQIQVYNKPLSTHTVESGNIGIGTTSPTEKLEVDGNVKITNNLILANGSNSISQTILRAMTQSEARTITLPDASGIVLVTDDGSITVPDGTITASKLANNPGNGITGQVLISNGDGTFDWENPGGIFTSEGNTHIVETGNVGIGTGSPTEKLEVDGNVKITNDLILANGSSSVSQTILKAMTQSEARTINLPDASGIVVVTDDGNITVPDGSITASKLANNPGNGITGQTLISNGDGSFAWADVESVFTTEANNHTVETGNVGIGTTSPTEQLEVDGNVKLTNGLILTTGSSSFSQTTLKAMTQSEARTITLPDASGVVIVTDDGTITAPDGSITASKLANNPGNGPSGQTLISNGDGSFDWRGFVTTPESVSASFDYSFGNGQGSEIGQFNSIRDIAFDSNDNIYVADYSNHRIQVFTSSGEYSYSIGTGNNGTGDNDINSPKSIEIDSNDNIYVQEGSRIHIFTAQGNNINSFGGIGFAEGEFGDVYGIAMDNDGNIYVADAGMMKNCIHIFSNQGNFNYSYSSKIDHGGNTYDVAIDNSGNIYVSDDLNCNINIYDDQKNLIDAINNGFGTGPGQLNMPRGIDVDSDGLIYVAELINHRIQVFTATGDYSYSISDGLSFPSCVTVHKNKIYIGDGSNCIMIFDKPGKPATHIVETGNVGIGTTAPSDTLDVSGTFKITEALKLQPRDTPPDVASEGMVYFDSGDNKLKVYNGTEWKVCF